MNLVRYFVSAMIAPEGESSVVAVPVTPPRVRNRFIVQKRHGLRRRVFVEITDAPPRSDGTARVQFRAVNIRGKGDERLGFHLQTLAMGSRIVYESEIEAQKKLESLIESSEYELYVVTGMLSVVGKSGTLYVIRKSRPTLAFAQGEKK